MSEDLASTLLMVVLEAFLQRMGLGNNNSHIGYEAWLRIDKRVAGSHANILLQLIGVEVVCALVLANASFSKWERS